ncbi:hypothetical protein MUG78_03665 [Gordonia alkaliphila]|uniref:DUF2127 domain-containing protein n=1 Tax=Gordonia alkaliphila TaxID=1053547 RepID=A0ABP8Z291_9ACTN|nr:hypothetical protein [Gordonia alkaliphila]MCK0438584.1 hypothetical protein [Gordonia alkaliphila]
MTVPLATRPTAPESVRTAGQLVAIALVFELIAFAGSYSTIRADAFTYAKKMAEGPNGPQNVDQMATIVAVLSIVIASVVALVFTAGLLWLVWRGIGWARFLLAWVAAVIAVMLVIDVLGLLLGFSPGDGAADLPTWAMIPRILGGVAAMGAAAALLHPDTKKFLDASAAYRREGHGPHQRGDSR